MALAKQRPLFKQPTDYEDDFEQWAYEQAELLRQRRFSEADLPNVIEELESMGRKERLQLEAGYRLVIAHLLKWQFQPQLRSASWDVTIARERTHIAASERINHALRKDARRLVDGVYRDAVREASKETGLPRDSFPLECPYTIEQLRDPDWMPE